MKHFVFYLIAGFSILLFFSPFIITLFLTLKWRKKDSEVVKPYFSNKAGNYFLIIFGFYILIIAGFAAGYFEFIVNRGAITDFQEDGWTGMYSFENSKKAELTAFIIPVITFVVLLILFVRKVRITSRLAYLSIFFFIYSYVLFAIAITMSYRSDSPFINSSERKIIRDGE